MVQSTNLVSEKLDKDQAYQVELKINNLLESLPDGSHAAEMKPVGKYWFFRFGFVSPGAIFGSSAFAKTPQEACDIVAISIDRQIADWREQRFSGDGSEQAFVGKSDNAIPADLQGDPALPIIHDRENHKHPNVLIIDDDPDAAETVDLIFKEFGCRTNIASNIAQAEQLLSQGQYDFIVLDWILDHDARGNEVVENSIKNIESYDYLKEFFSRHKPKIITYSGLNNSEIQLPKTSYFDYVDHWQKPFGFQELKQKTSELLRS